MVLLSPLYSRITEPLIREAAFPDLDRLQDWFDAIQVLSDVLYEYGIRPRLASDMEALIASYKWEGIPKEEVAYQRRQAAVYSWARHCVRHEFVRIRILSERVVQLSDPIQDRYFDEVVTLPAIGLPVVWFPLTTWQTTPIDSISFYKYKGIPSGATHAQAIVHGKKQFPIPMALPVNLTVGDTLSIRKSDIDRSNTVGFSMIPWNQPWLVERPEL